MTYFAYIRKCIMKGILVTYWQPYVMNLSGTSKSGLLTFDFSVLLKWVYHLPYHRHKRETTMYLARLRRAHDLSVES